MKCKNWLFILLILATLGSGAGAEAQLKPRTPPSDCEQLAKFIEDLAVEIIDATLAAQVYQNILEVPDISDADKAEARNKLAEMRRKIDQKKTLEALTNLYILHC